MVCSRGARVANQPHSPNVHPSPSSSTRSCYAGIRTVSLIRMPTGTYTTTYRSDVLSNCGSHEYEGTTGAAKRERRGESVGSVGGSRVATPNIKNGVSEIWLVRTYSWHAVASCVHHYCVLCYCLTQASCSSELRGGEAPRELPLRASGLSPACDSCESKAC